MESIETIGTAVAIWRGVTTGIERQTGTRKAMPWLGRMIQMVAGVTGSVLFFASFGIFLMPLIAGWTWFGAAVGFIALQYSSQILLDLPAYWVRAAAFLLIVRMAAKGSVKDGLSSLVEMTRPRAPAQA